MKFKCILALLLSIGLIGQLQAEDAIADDGRKVQLNKDGSWKFTSTDRFATTVEGKRVRLKEDGSWSYTGGKAVVGPQEVSDERFVDDQSVAFTISDLSVEMIKDSNPKVKRRNTQTIYYLNIKRNKDVVDAKPLTITADDFTVDDSDGRKYPVVRMSPASVTVNPGDNVNLVVRAKGSPKWWTTRDMSIALDKKVVSGVRDIKLTRRQSSVKKVFVTEFSAP